jgi:predicted dehydrogenase
MADKAAASDLLLMEAFMYRFHPRSRRIKKMVAEGVIGKPCLVRSAFCYHMDDDIVKSGGNARLKPDLGGGALLDVGCYSVNVARWFMDAEPTTVQAQAVCHPDGVDVHLVGTLRFAEGQLAVLEASFISAPWEKNAVYIQRAKDEEVGNKHMVRGADQYQLMVEHFADAVLKRKTLVYSPHDSIANMRVLDALSEAARTGNAVSL